MLKLINSTIVCIGLVLSNNAFASDIAKCGSSAGYSYYADRGINQKKDTGWTEDKISKGKLTLTQREDREFDILFVDATDKITSASSDGAKIFLIDLSDDSITILAVYPFSLETYSFQKTKTGSNELMWTQNKSNSPIPKISAFISECSDLNLSAIKKSSNTN